MRKSLKMSQFFYSPNLLNPQRVRHTETWTGSGGRRSRVIRYIGALCALGVVAGCSTPKTPLKGDRIAISSLETQSLRLRTSQQPVGPLPAAVQIPQWPQPDLNAGHDKGHASLGGGKGPLKVLWDRNVSSPHSEGRILETPVVGKDGLFFLDHRGRVCKVDPKTGREIFAVSIAPQDKTNSPVLGGGCCVSDKFVFVASPYSELLALDATDGRIVWRADLLSPGRCAPTLHDGQLYVTTLQNHVHAFNLSGELLWTHEAMPELLGILGLASPAAWGDFVIVAATSGELFALRSKTGSVVWSEIMTGPRNMGEAQSLPHIRANPVIHEGQVFAVSYGGQLAAFNLYNGRRGWDVPSLSTTCAPLIAGDTLFTLANNRDLVALSQATGDIIWSISLETLLEADKQAPETHLMWYGPLLVDGLLLVLSSKGDLISVDPQTGKHIPGAPKLSVSDRFSLAPIVANGLMYLLSNSGNIYGIGHGG